MPLPVSSPREPMVNDFPARARIALAHVLDEMRDNDYLVSEQSVIRELDRIGRLTATDVEEEPDESFFDRIKLRLELLEWDQVLLFCERAYEKLLTSPPYGNPDFAYHDYQIVRQFFEDEINQILDEDHIAFFFQEGKFRRRGRPHTWHMFEGVGKVLIQPRFRMVKHHYNKAREFFDLRPASDAENCVKECICALEACLAAVTGEDASNNFNKVVNRRKGNAPGFIPSPIAEGMQKLYAYRGSAQGVAHAALQGNRVTALEAELVLSLTAAYITYLADLYPEDELP